MNHSTLLDIFNGDNDEDLIFIIEAILPNMNEEELKSLKSLMRDDDWTINNYEPLGKGSVATKLGKYYVRLTGLEAWKQRNNRKRYVAIKR